MFDLGSAVVLGLVLMGLVTMAYGLYAGPKETRLKILICLAVAIITVQLVAASDFASEQVVLNRTLNSLNFWSQLVISLLAAGIAAAAWETVVKAVRNIGQNQNDNVHDSPELPPPVAGGHD